MHATHMGTGKGRERKKMALPPPGPVFAQDNRMMCKRLERRAGIARDNDLFY